MLHTLPKKVGVIAAHEQIGKAAGFETLFEVTI